MLVQIRLVSLTSYWLLNLRWTKSSDRAMPGDDLALGAGGQLQVRGTFSSCWQGCPGASMPVGPQGRPMVLRE